MEQDEEDTWAETVREVYVPLVIALKASIPFSKLTSRERMDLTNELQLAYEQQDSLSLRAVVVDWVALENLPLINFSAKQYNVCNRVLKYRIKILKEEITYMYLSQENCDKLPRGCIHAGIHWREELLKEKERHLNTIKKIESDHAGLLSNFSLEYWTTFLQGVKKACRDGVYFKDPE